MERREQVREGEEKERERKGRGKRKRAEQNVLIVLLKGWAT